jgi:hypothetical protein
MVEEGEAPAIIHWCAGTDNLFARFSADGGEGASLVAMT